MQKKCSVDGCDKIVYCLGYCTMHYARLHRHNDLNFVSRSPSGLYKNNKREWRSWQMMKQRCYNTSYTQYKDYGGRGIKVCDRWQGKYGFRNFLEDMGKRPSGCSLDRINNDGDYMPDNCKWSTRYEQANNTRFNRVLEYKGEKHTMSEWARIKFFPPYLLYNRLMTYKWTLERALETPLKKKTRRTK